MVDLSGVIKASHKKYGANTFSVGLNPLAEFPRIPTGIFPFDFALGGGLPVRVTSCIYGPPSGGKTTTAILACAGAQRICWKCFEYSWSCECEEPDLRSVVWITTEDTAFDTEWATALGLDLDKFVLVEPSSGEQAVDILIETLRADDCGLVVLDSIAMLTPEKELEISAASDQVALQARLVSKLIRKTKATFIREKKRGHPVSWLAINQLRASISSSPFGPTENIPGGYAAKHDFHWMGRISQLKSSYEDAGTKLPARNRFHLSMGAQMNKRKIFTLTGVAEWYVATSLDPSYTQGTITDFKSVLEHAARYGVPIDSDTTEANILDKLSEREYLSLKWQIIREAVRQAKVIAGLMEA